MTDIVYTLKVTLRGVRPPIWRRIEVPSAVSLADLHRILQVAMGWTDSHLHQFIHGGTCYGAADREFGMEVISERRTRLDELVTRPKERLTYEYDFGDSWEHEVVLERIGPADATVRYPRVVDGRRACPPEDVGGVPGYAAFVDAISNAEHEEHAAMVEWAGGPFDAEAFDVAEANLGMPKKRSPRRRDA